MQVDYNQFQNWFTLRMNMLTNGQTWENITSNQVDDLLGMWDYYYTWAGRNAMAVLNNYQDGEYFIPPLQSNGGWAPRAFGVDELSKPEQAVSVYPNPASYIVNVKLQLKETIYQTGILKITDIAGKLIEEKTISHQDEHIVLDTRAWGEGVYLWQVSIPGVLQDHGRIEVIH